MKSAFCVLTTLLALSRQSLSQTGDPVSHFCHRFGHQTAVIGRRLYIDGGSIQYENEGNITNKRLVYHDLDDAQSQMPQLKLDLSKDAYVPFVSGGVLWSDSAKQAFYLYGGEFDNGTEPGDSSLWRYDIANGRWSLVPDTSQRIAQRLSWGAGAVVEDRLEGYWYGGWQNNRTTPGWQGSARSSDRMLTYHIDDNRWSNSTGPDALSRAEGAMVYLPASDSGLLVYFGGIVDPFQNGTLLAENMSIIYVYDIQSSKWYTQNATGEVPEARRRFCAGATWAKDQSSYNVYLFGGASMDEGPGFDDVYILTMPSFTWIKAWTADPPEKPHHSLTCNVISNSQMLIIGGVFPLQPRDCDSPEVWGIHNLKLGGNDGRMQWMSFDPDLTEYHVPAIISDKIGGGLDGGATVTQPDRWSNRDLEVYFSKKVIPKTSPTSTNTPQRNDLSTGAIVGISVGSFIFLFTILSCAFLLFRQRKHSDHAKIELPASTATGTPAMLFPAHHQPGAISAASPTVPPPPVQPFELYGQQQLCELESPVNSNRKWMTPQVRGTPGAQSHFREEWSPRSATVDLDTYTPSSSTHGY